MKLKHIPEDFVVEEQIELKLQKEAAEYSIWKLTKRDWESFRIIEAISKCLNTRVKFIGFAGNKDRNAVTTQYISIYKIPKDRVDNIKINGVTLEFLGYSSNRINLGDLKGNSFKIILRDLDKKVKLPDKLYLENYFDEQRFGNKLNTHLVGKALLKRNFKEVCNLLKIEVDKNDYINTIKKQQLRLLRFYISSYQSFIWNRILKEILKKEKNVEAVETPIGELLFTTKNIKNFKIPIINFDTEKDKIIDKILKEEDVKKEDFIMREMPELVSETTFRDAFIEVEDIKSNFSDDELHKDKLKLELEFFLPKGAYATMLVKKLGCYLK